MRGKWVKWGVRAIALFGVQGRGELQVKQRRNAGVEGRQ